jgi:hypothetical protein
MANIVVNSNQRSSKVWNLSLKLSLHFVYNSDLAKLLNQNFVKTENLQLIFKFYKNISKINCSFADSDPHFE